MDFKKGTGIGAFEKSLDKFITEGNKKTSSSNSTNNTFSMNDIKIKTNTKNTTLDKFFSKKNNKEQEKNEALKRISEVEELVEGVSEIKNINQNELNQTNEKQSENINTLVTTSKNIDAELLEICNAITPEDFGILSEIDLANDEIYNENMYSGSKKRTREEAGFDIDLYLDEEIINPSKKKKYH